MQTRRHLMKTAGLASLAAAAAGTARADTAGAKSDSMPKPYAGAHVMPKGVTLLAIRQDNGDETLGVKTKNGVLDVVKAAKLLNMDAPATLQELLVVGNAPALDALIKAAATNPKAKAAMLDEGSIKFGRMFIEPKKIVCVGLNYRAHAAETGEKTPKQPILFNKYNNSLAAHQCTIKLPPQDVSHKLDYETELLVVMGKTARNVSEADALNYVAGYAVGHDFSARDLQLETGGQWMVGKTLDAFAPIGPYFVSADQIDPNNLHIQTRVNGETRQDANTSQFIFNPQKVISYTSKLFALEPGDIIFTGTPSGVILGMPKDKQVWLKAGDKIESEIAGLGVLKFDLA